MAASAETEQSDELVRGKEGRGLLLPIINWPWLRMRCSSLLSGIQAWKCMQQAYKEENERDLEVLIDGVVKIQ